MVEYRTLVADPPWPFGDKLPGASRGAEKNYRVLSLDDIGSFLDAYAPDGSAPEDGEGCLPSIRESLAPDCRLFLWRVASMQREALSTMSLWGFGEPKTELIWRKTTTNGKRHFGMGRTLRAEHETCLIGARGKPLVLNRSTRSVLDADEEGVDECRRCGFVECACLGGPPSYGSVFEASYVGHSVKPDAFYDLVERLSPGPFLELFARRRRPGWTCLGDELPLEVA